MGFNICKVLWQAFLVWGWKLDVTVSDYSQVLFLLFGFRRALQNGANDKYKRLDQTFGFLQNNQLLFKANLRKIKAPIKN